MTSRLAAMTVAILSLFCVLPAHANDSGDTWWLKTFRNADAAAAATQPTRTAKSTKAAPRIASNDDSDRPQRRQSTKQAKAPSVVSSGSGQSGSGQSGVASYYWQPQPVASGGRFNPEAMTAAHKTLPFGTRVRVTRVDTGRSVEVTINDRGPYIAGRIIDLSRRAARDIGMTDVGIARVNVAVIGR